MANIKVKVLNKNTLELLEDAKAGDLIELDTITKIDTGFINELILKHKDEVINEKINEVKEQLTSRSLQEKEAIKVQNQLALNAKDLEKEKALAALKDSLNNDLANLKEKIVKLENENAIIKSNFDAQSKLKIAEETRKITEQFSSEITKKQNEINSLNSRLEMNKLMHEKDLENCELKVSNNFKDKIKELETERLKIQSDLENLQLRKDSNSVKVLGEQLEHWCNEEYENARVSGFENCEWKKDNNAVVNELDSDDRATKADYIFKMYTNSNFTEENLITSVCLEMKNEAPNSVNKRTNKSYYAKLDKDRNKKGLEYALLVSELEWEENDAPIKKIPEYDKMYMVRPQYMITFLSIIYTLGKRYRDLILSIRENDEELKDIIEINEEFESFKETYVIKPINELNKQLEKMRKNSSNIIEAANSINQEIDLITSKTINNIFTKIDTFTIKKDRLNKKINKINK